MRADYDDHDYAAKPVDMTPLPRWRALFGDACIVGAIVIAFWSIKDVF